ncbi:MAG: hypothetical protein LBU06_01880, partial [Desulfovibrio sp.]|nr:hypothetical protein [Desulfovibrio sp.]
MTTKYKIIVSFVVMTVIIGGVSVLGYVSLDTASSSFMEYRRLARLDVIASDIVAGQHQAAAAMRQFRLEPHKPEHMDAVVRILLDDRKLAEEALTIMQAPETIALGDSIKKGTDDQIGLDESYKVTMTDFMDLYNKTVQPNNRAVGAELAAVAEMSAEAGNVPALLTTALALKDLAWYRSAVSRFAFTRTPGDAKYTLELLDALNKAVAALSGSVVSEKGLVALAKLTTAMGAADKATRTMVDKGKEMDEVLASLVSLSRKVSKDGIDLNRQITVLRGRMGTETLQSNERGQKAMLAGSAVGMALAVLMSLAIVVGLVRVLRDTGGFADAVAAGRFDHQIKTREKGEIGGMIAAMRRIPDVLQTIVADYLDLEAKIKAGLLDSTGDAEKISGGFSTIIMG